MPTFQHMERGTNTVVEAPDTVVGFGGHAYPLVGAELA